jgi:TM2 domain-containing membrane protein YozV
MAQAFALRAFSARKLLGITLGFHISHLWRWNRKKTLAEQNSVFRRMRFRNSIAGGKTMRDPFTAGLLSFIIPGVGQLYNGRILAGILWLIITPGFWIGSGGTLGWICHVIAAYTAYSYAKDHPVRV